MVCSSGGSAAPCGSVTWHDREASASSARRWNGSEQYRYLPWRGIAGMSDLLIHPHDRVDFEEIKHAYQQFLAMRILEIINVANVH
jgi:uncharacterized protein with HEPN domain